MLEDRLNSLLSAWQEQQLQGHDVSAAELCRDCPELAEELGRRIAVLRQMNELVQPRSAAPVPNPEAGAGAPGDGRAGSAGQFPPSDGADAFPDTLPPSPGEAAVLPA